MPLLPPVDYISWARENLDEVEIPLGASGLPPMPAEEVVEFDFDRVDVTSFDESILAQARRAVAERMQTRPDKVVITSGSSHGNFLTPGSLINYGSRIAVEFPYYQQLKKIAEMYNPEARAMDLRREGGWGFSEEGFRSAINADADIILCTSPQNPTGVVLDRDLAHEAGEMARFNDCWILVDEIYAEFLFDDFEGTIQEVHPRIIATGGFTKFAGLRGFRFGWTIAEPETATWIRRSIDLTVLAVNSVTPQLALQVFEQFDAVEERARQAASPEKRKLVADFIDTRDELRWHEPEVGLVGFVKLDHPDLTVNRMVDRLIEEHKCVVSPGRFFGMSDHFRIGWSLPEEQVEKGLNCIAEVLDYA